MFKQAEKISKLRYGAYEAEQWLVARVRRWECFQAARVYVLLTVALCRNKNVLKTARSVLTLVKVIQLREKHPE